MLMSSLQGFTWADLEDDSVDSTPAGRLADSAIRDPSMGVSELSMGSKRSLEIGCSSWFTDDGFDDRPMGDVKRLKGDMGDFSHSTNLSDESYQQPMSEANAAILANGVQTLMVPIPVLAVPLAIAPDVGVVASVPPQGTLGKPRSAEETIQKREEEIAEIQGKFSADVVNMTPMGRALDFRTITKRPWEEAKAEYRARLKFSSLKSQTQNSDDTIRRALKIVHQEGMKAKDHVELALAFIPRLDDM